MKLKYAISYDLVAGKLLEEFATKKIAEDESLHKEFHEFVQSEIYEKSDEDNEVKKLRKEIKNYKKMVLAYKKLNERKNRDVYKLQEEIELKNADIEQLKYILEIRKDEIKNNNNSIKVNYKSDNKFYEGNEFLLYSSDESVDSELSNEYREIN